MLREPHRGERGQSLLVLGLVLLVLIGFVALAVDGGNAYAQRRIMQNAADSGALAGIRELAFGDPAAAVAAAQEYVLERNAADEVSVTVGTQEILVVVRTSFDTYLGAVLEVFNLTTGARACAMFGAPTALYDQWFFPVLLRDDDFSPTMEYEIWDDKKEYEGEDEGVISGGNRGWGNFNGGDVSKSDIMDWCLNGWLGDMAVGDWINGSPGTAASGVEVTWTYRVGDTVIIPLYDDTRPGEMGSGQVDFHISGFAAFTITQVFPEDTPKKIVGHFTRKFVVAPVGTQQHNGLVAVRLCE